MARKTSGSYKEVLIFLLITIVGSLVYFGPILITSWSLMDRYKLINRSESYFSEGRYDESIAFAHKAYKYALSPKDIAPPVLFMQYFYEKSDFYRKNNFNKLYQATINLAYCLQAKGIEINQAESLYIKSIYISKKLFPDNPEYLLFPTVGCFKIYLAKGDNIKSDSCYVELSKVLVNLNKFDAYYKAQSLVLYAAFADRNHAIEKAIALRKEALEISRILKSTSKGTNYASLLLAVTLDCIKTNELAQADSYLKECGKVLSKKKKRKIYREYLMVNAQYLEIVNDTIEAEKVLLQLLDLTLNTPGTSDLDIAVALYSVAAHYFRTQRFALANKFFNKSLKAAVIIEKDFPIVYNDILFGSALSDFKMHLLYSSLKKVSQLELFFFDQFDKYFLFMPEEEKERYIENLENKINLLNCVRISVGDSVQIENIFNNVLAIKAVALESNRFIRDILNKAKFFKLSQNFKFLKHKKEELELKRITGSLPIEYYTLIEDSIRRMEIRMIKSIVHNADFSRFKVNSANWLNIRSYLKKSQVAIEFINLPLDPLFPEKKTYFALLIKPESKSPSLIKLCDESEIAKLIKHSGSTKSSINKIYTGDSFYKLYNLIWDPLNDYLKDSEKVYVSLSGILYQISLPAITIDEEYDIEILSNTRNLVFMNNSSIKESTQKAVLYGDIDYNNVDITPAAGRLGKFDKEISKHITRAGISQLPGTKKEIKLINDILIRNKIDARRIVKKSATETSFKCMSNNTPDILHVATHGFYFPQDKYYQMNKLISVNIGKKNSDINPLFRSGLLFAGANMQLHNPNNDGILTSYEISKLDLSNTDLLVLSACETGLGDIRGGEGVYGLQRAFKLAGVESMIISLWKVPDEETCILMQKFYENLIDNQYDKRKSLRMAQQYLRKKLNKDPFFWGAFEIVE